MIIHLFDLIEALRCRQYEWRIENGFDSFFFEGTISHMIVCIYPSSIIPTIGCYGKSRRD